jgi:hypothetical protein
MKNVTLLRIELVNKSDMLIGMVDCLSSEVLSFTTTLTSDLAGTWFQSGENNESLDRKVTWIRAIMKIDDREVQRTFSVLMARSYRKVGEHTMQPFVSLSGAC